MPDPERYWAVIKSRFPDYRLSWEILTEIVVENVARGPYWLDVGAGPNILIQEQPGAEFAVALDIAKPAEVKLDSRNPYCVASANKLPFKNDSFDFITSRYTFEHLESPKKALAEIERLLKPGGIFVLQTTNARSPLIMLSRLLPFGLKKGLLRKLLGNAPSGVFKTYYRMNKPSLIRSHEGSLTLIRFVLVEDVLCHNRFVFTLSSWLYALMRLPALNSLRNNMIAVYRKEKGPIRSGAP